MTKTSTTETLTSTNRNRRILVAALLVGAGFLLSKITGILDDIILGRMIGLSSELDAYYAAFYLPDLLFTLVAGGALASAFIPIMSGLILENRSEAWRLTSAVVNVAFLVTLIASIVLTIIAPWLVSVSIGSGFAPEYQALTADLMRVILISTAIFSASAIVMSALQAHQHFLLPALAPIMYNIGILAGVIFLAPTMGVWGPAIGVVIGALLHLLIQVPGLIKYGARWTPWLGWRDAHVRRVLVLLAPRVAGLGVVQLATVITVSLASELGEGSVTALNFGWRVMQLPETVIATAIATAVFPTFSELASQGKLDELRAMLSSTLRVLFALTIPATFALIILGRPFVQVLFEGDLFTSAATDTVVWALQGYALGLVAHASLEVCARSFYAQQDTYTPLYVAIGAMTINILASLALRGPLGHGGLALGNSIGVTVEVVVLLLIARRRLSGIDERRILKALARFIVGSVAMAGAIILSQSTFTIWSLPDGLVLDQRIRSVLEVGVPLVVASGLGLLVYLIVTSLLGSEEVRSLPRLIIRRKAT